MNSSFLVFFGEVFIKALFDEDDNFVIFFKYFGQTYLEVISSYGGSTGD